MNHSLEQFSPLLNEEFILRDENGVENQAVLIEAVAAGSGDGSESSNVPFSLLFRVAPNAIPAEAARQGTYLLSQQALAPMNLFLVPVDANSDGVYFEAVFN